MYNITIGENKMQLCIHRPIVVLHKKEKYTSITSDDMSHNVGQKRSSLYAADSIYLPSIENKIASTRGHSACAAVYSGIGRRTNKG